MAKRKPVGASANLTRKQVDRLKAPFELDLIAFYNALEEETMMLVSKMVRAGNTGDEIIGAVEDLLDE